MTSAYDKLKGELVGREEALLRKEARRDPDTIAGLIEDRCVEVTIAGQEREYRIGDCLESVDGELYIDDGAVSMTEIAEDAVLLRYVGARVKKNLRQKARFCSVWKKSGGQWKLAFRQGTIIVD
jgi:hypothetical protein